MPAGDLIGVEPLHERGEQQQFTPLEKGAQRTVEQRLADVPGHRISVRAVDLAALHCSPALLPACASGVGAAEPGTAAVPPDAAAG
ncbi:hypothetical protein OOK31_37160 [Streptomyces sp. NBC_00249]|uniref:hypothetical protein n=1 Tax=Streptomyces sp. NBC_00249 TaxID=2975690 RepID=UPI00224DAEC2|nr:hypothetical protein [Streptomyces sp. NBC_00249]MCX5199441.1 hypothetical protein [Streptomyces sp. NBC_00249]